MKNAKRRVIIVHAEVSTAAKNKKGNTDMNSKKKKIVGIVTNVLVVVILVFVALITMSIILSSGKGYTSLFGSAYVAVESDSMERDNYDGFAYPHEVEGFNKGDLIKIHILSEDQKGKLQVGDVVTFYFMKDGVRQLNTHRIVGYGGMDQNGVISTYTTQGDQPGAPVEQVSVSNLVGQYEGRRVAGLGKAVDFFHSSVGFFVCVVLPSLLIVAYFAVNLVLTIKSVKSVYKEAEQKDEKERMREELMKELREQGKIKEETPSESQAPEGPSDGEAK